MAKRREPLADIIARNLGGNWRAERWGFGWRYMCDDGRTITRYARPCFQFGEYSDSRFFGFYAIDGTDSPLTFLPMGEFTTD